MQQAVVQIDCRLLPSPSSRDTKRVYVYAEYANEEAALIKGEILFTLAKSRPHGESTHHGVWATHRLSQIWVPKDKLATLKTEFLANATPEERAKVNAEVTAFSFTIPSHVALLYAQIGHIGYSADAIDAAGLSYGTPGASMLLGGVVPAYNSGPHHFRIGDQAYYYPPTYQDLKDMSDRRDCMWLERLSDVDGIKGRMFKRLQLLSRVWGDETYERHAYMYGGRAIHGGAPNGNVAVAVTRR